MSRDVPLLVDANWLATHCDSVIPVDGTWLMPGTTDDLAQGFIPNARRFDLDEIATLHPTLKHMLPSAQQFSRAVGDMGISADDHIIAYDRHGVFSSPRLWWTFKMFGHAKVSVLDGGLPAWIAAGQSVDAKPIQGPSVTYSHAAPLCKVASKDDVLSAIRLQTQIIDARPPGRFHGTTPEPRADLRGGHMPSACNVPFGSLRTDNSHLKSIESLIDAFAAIDPSHPIITTCGSGITASALAFVLAMIGADDVSVYDGSWAEWGADEATPISTRG